MSCHFSCASTSCTSSAFNSCTACPAGASLHSGACFCSTAWDSACTLMSGLKSMFLTLDTFYVCLFPLLIILFCLKAKTPIAYRVLVNLQGFSMLIFSNQYYLYYQAFFGLKTLYKGNGLYGSGVNRLQSLSIGHALPAIVMFGGLLVGLFAMYYPIKTFVKQYESYSDYLSDNWAHFLFCFYYFAARSMVYFIGSWLNSVSTSAGDIILVAIFGLIVAGIVCKTIYDFHQNKLESGIYEQEIYLYVIISPLSILGLPLAQSSLLYMLVYLSPLGLLFLVILLNRNYEIFTKPKVFFYIVEAIIPVFAVLFILVADAFKGIIVLIATGLSVIIVIIQLSVAYHSGVSLEKSAKVHPQGSQEAQSIKSEDKTDEENKASQKGKSKNVRKASYF